MHKFFYITEEIKEKEKEADKQLRKEAVRNWLEKQGITSDFLEQIRANQSKGGIRDEGKE